MRYGQKRGLAGVVAGLAASLLGACNVAGGPTAGDHCRPVTHKSNPYTVCTFNAARDDIRLFYTAEDGEPYLQFDTLAEAMADEGKTLVFAMNGGMYHDDRRPVGYLRHETGEQASVNTNEGPGNFHMKPNGVFWLDEDHAGVTESQAYLDEGLDPAFATQSGPMLVIDGEIHPAINPSGTSRKRRNGVGVSRNGETVAFAISDVPVTFHDFASLYRDKLNMPNALFLDGQVSRLYAPAMGRDEPGLDMGPIVGVVE
ncbi:phosphodiester glycosidase family protein [Henriciella aquimarina]|uniref:phosphodiester glycosidase family protein n=1 Tax=Henriciella aquimarina TaxID=545261 RepID=UPI001F313E91|nr:phosphodiester glycosidase family protein [Henriciella aquimarina]